MNREKSDLWKDWLLQHRYGGDARIKQQVLDDVARYADRVLDGAGLGAGMTLVDVGAGDGLVALRAIERVGPSLKAVMTDISEPLLDHARARAAGQGVLDQCAFVQGSADAMPGLADGSVDAVATRAAVAYVADKPAAFREFHRVLRPGGRLSIAEPVMRDDGLEVCALKKLVDAQGPAVSDPFFSMMLRWRSALYPDTEEKLYQCPITNFGERDLVRYAVDAGFTDIHLEFHIDVRDKDQRLPLDAYLDVSPHPLAPTLNQVLEERFTPDERLFFKEKLRALYESTNRFSVDRIAWMTARKSA